MGVTDVHLRVTHAIQKEPLVKLSELPNNIKVIKVYE